MANRTPTSRAIEVPDLVGVRADHAIGRLRELGLLPMTWSTAVDHVGKAGVVLGLEPPAGSPVRPRALITLSIAAHPEFRGHADDSLHRPADKVVKPTVTGPEGGDYVASSPAEPRDDVAQLQRRGLLQMELW